MRKEHSQQQQKKYYTNNRLVKPGTLLRIVAKNHTLCCTVLFQHVVTYKTYLESHFQYIMSFLFLLTVLFWVLFVCLFVFEQHHRQSDQQLSLQIFIFVDFCAALECKALLHQRYTQLEGRHTLFKGYKGSALALQEDEFYPCGLKANVEIDCKVFASNQTWPTNIKPLSNLCMCQELLFSN